ncbi:MAG TPA: substrate-binding domain-containing protein [Candidatus Limnocylindria bacterium]|nr:substrate-binding domain-containing protein [Candidatus Limnocylindria bacterium]
MLRTVLLALAFATIVVAACAPAPDAQRREVLLATTTSFQDSGLLDDLVSDFALKTGYRIRATAVGSGAAIALGAKGDADVVFAHSEQAELDFMAQGHGERRVKVMHNDFVILGPPADPARAKGRGSVEAIRAIAAAGATFYSRGDRSGTDVFEKGLWKQAGITPAAPWYVEAATGMGQTLQIASEKRAYTIADRATFLARKSALELAIVAEKEPPLFNYYHVMTVNPAKHPGVNAAGALAFVEYLTSAETQRRIARFGIAQYGEPLFYPDAAQ